MNLLQITKEIGLEHDKIQTIRFKETIFKVVRAKYTDNNISNKLISEYFIVDCSGNNLRLLLEGDGLTNFHEFQSELLSRYFFEQMDDLRWNIYLLLLTDESYGEYNNIKIQQIENDDNYARKLVLDSKEAVSLIRKDWLYNEQVPSINISDPTDIWLRKLEEVGLSGCLSNEAKSEYVSKYLQGENFVLDSDVDRKSRKPLSEAFNIPPRRIREIKISKFRNHCFMNNESIRPKLVNLINGSNGSGKTSILEAIELAMTDSIARVSSYGDDDFKKTSKVQVICSSIENEALVPYENGNASTYYKKLEEVWYGKPIGRARNTLNYNFSRFNYFNSEAAFKFALEESPKKNGDGFNYGENLSQLVFGEDILRIQKSWLWYKEKFDEKKVELTKLIQKSDSKISELRANIQENHENSEINIIEIKNLLEDTRLNDNIKIMRINEEMSRYLERIEFYLHATLPVSENIKDINFLTGTITVNRLNSEIEIINKILNEYQRNLTSLSDMDIELEKEADTMKNNYSLLIEFNTTNNQLIRELQSVLLSWNNISKVIENWALVDKKIVLKRNEATKSIIIDRIRAFKFKYGDIWSYSEDDLETIPESELILLQNSLVNKTNLLNRTKEQVVLATKAIGEVKALLTSIRKDGVEYIRLDDKSTTCPLCKHNYDNHESLAKSIEKADFKSDTNESLLLSLEQSKEKLLKDIEELNFKINANQKNRGIISHINSAFREIQEPSLLSSQSNTENSLEQLKLVVSLDKEFEKNQKEFDEIQKELRLLNESGFDDAIIAKSESFIECNKEYKEYRDNNSTYTFNQYILAKISVIEEDIRKAELRLQELDSKTSVINEKRSKLELDKYKGIIEEYQNQINSMQKLLNSIKALESEYIINSECDLRNWLVYVERARTQVGHFITMYEKLEKYKHLNTQLESEIQNDTYLKNQYQRCEIACSTLTELPRLKDFTNEFLQANKEKIEKLFKLLHTPREFDNLSIDEEGITINRKSDGRLIRAYQMSTGQRASLALSVMFTLHLAAKNAPKFLLLDEPVANMDDMHLLNLLDLIRDLTIQGRQVFFTTANPDVSNLFRRKFSFLGDEFSHLELLRHPDDPVHIQEMNNKPNNQ